MERTLEGGNESEHTRFPWPQTDNPLEWLLGLIFGAVWSLLVGFWRAVAAMVSGRGTLAQWVWVCLLVAVALVICAPLLVKPPATVRFQPPPLPPVAP